MHFERFATHVQICLVTNQLVQNFVAKTNSIMGNMKAADNACSKNLYMGERLKAKYGLFVDIIQYRDLNQNPRVNFVFYWEMFVLCCAYPYHKHLHFR